jgi:hypothetical protein
MSVSHQPATDEHVGRSCPYCRFSFKRGVGVVGCPSCRAVHHDECWEENGGCAVLGCKSAPTAPVPAAVPPVPIAPPATFPAPAPPPAFVAPAPPRPGVPAPVIGAGVTLPGAAELLDRVRKLLATPVVAAAGRSAAMAAAAMLVFGLALALLTPAGSTLSFGGDGLFKETMRTTVATTMARFDSFTYLPLLFVFVPLVAAAWAARRAGRHLVDDPPTEARLLAGALTGIPLAAMMLVVGALASTYGSGPSALSVIGFCILWGGFGGLLGAARASGPGSLGTLTSRLPRGAARPAALAQLALRPLALLLAITAVLGIAAWTVQIARGQVGAKNGRSTVVALAETPFYAAEYAVGMVTLGSLGEVRPLGEGGSVRSTPLPLDDDGDFEGFGESWRVFELAGNYPLLVAILMLVVLIGFPLALAGYAGLTVAAAAGARTPGTGAAYGASVGLAWTIALMLLRAVGNMDLLVADSLFTFVLIVAGAAGAVGGLLAGRRAQAAPLAVEPAPT